MDPFDLRHWKGFAAAGGNTSAPAIVDQITIDSRRIHSSKSLFVPLIGRAHDGHKFIPHAIQGGASYVLAKKGWKPPQEFPLVNILYVDDPLKAFQEIAGAYRQQKSCIVVAIAGTHGKTMVKDLLKAMLSCSYHVVASPGSFNSQIGVPLSLLTIKDKHDIALIEAAISHKNEMEPLSKIIAPNHGILTHVGDKHITTLGSLDTVAEEIIKLFKGEENKWTLLPKDQHIERLIACLHSPSHYWTENNLSLPHAELDSCESGCQIPYRIDFPNGKLYQGIITSGFYYFLDLINISVKAAWMLGLPCEAISTTLKEYRPEPIRSEIWKSPIGATFINDTYCSDPQSVDKAFAHFQQSSNNTRKIFAFGGLKEKNDHIEADYRCIGQSIARSNIDLLMLFGNHSFDSLIQEVKAKKPNLEITHSPTYKETLNLLRARIKQEDIVLIKGDKKQPFDDITEAFNDSICNNQCIINLAAIEENIERIRKKLGNDVRLMVMVKALAYGTDDVRMAKFLETCHVDILGVSYVDEGAALKRAGASQSIFVINAAPYEAAKIVRWGLETGVSNRSMIEALAIESSRQNKKIKVHLHVDTGMGRFGCRPEEALGLAELIIDCPFLELEGIMSHFACADNPKEDHFTLSQIKSFNSTIEILKRHQINPKFKHIANSSGALRFDLPEYNMVRIGLAVYGLHSSKAAEEALELRLALTLISRIVGINLCKQGESISYGRTYSIEKPIQKIAVLPIGYFDGLHRNYSGKSSVIIRGKAAPMVGKICMDFMMVDVTDIPNAAPGDPVLIFGEDEYGHYLSPEDLATSGNSIIHELITCLGPRIQRVFVYEEARRKH